MVLFYKNQISFFKESYSVLILRARRSKDGAIDKIPRQQRLTAMSGFRQLADR